jgi:ubiquitin-activating enzyme E1
MNILIFKMSNTIDESLYSRQLYAIGKDTMQSLVNSRVLIIGLDSLGVEICKNIILMGVGMITISDNKNISEQDYGNYYISEKDLGKKRSDVLGKRLSELNSNCIVNKYSGSITNDVISKYHLVVFTDFKFNEFYFELNEYCRKKNVKTIFTQSRGFFGFVFCDFCNYYTNDSDGEKLKSGLLVSYSDIDKICTTDKPHDFAKDSKFKLNSSDEIYNITKILNQTQFKIDKSICTKLGEYTEIKNHLTQNFLSLRESIINPEFVITDFADFEMPYKLHNINVKILTNKLNELDLNDELTRKVLGAYDGFLTPMNSVIGGLCAHNIISGLSNKYTPIKQWLYYECLKICNPESSNWKYNSIYQNQVKVIGLKLQEKLNKTKIFIVGSGAIGCEHLKNFSMMGIGYQTITDMDTIEKSNLSRQFLFRNSDIGKFKSEIASQKAKKMNSNVRIEYKLNRVGNDTEHIFNNEFYSDVDIIVNALDNVNARLYMDNKAISHQKPLLESGTLGLKGNVQVILPHLTESYGSTTDKTEDQIPVCTLKNFPYEISHCIQWAREQFESLFVLPFQTYNKLKKYFVDNNLTDKLNKMLPNELYDINQNLTMIKSNIFDIFINFYNQNYRQKIFDLINQYPENHITEDGEKFWSGVKKFPKVIDFNDIDNDKCIKLLDSFMQIMNEIYESSQKYDASLIVEQINKKIECTSNKNALNTEEDKQIKDNMINMLDVDSTKDYIINFIKTTNYDFNEIEFEKDVDTNGHIKFITACSNLRAMNYNINPVSEFETKGIAGKIIPALATTTSIISGLVSIELYKLVNSSSYKIEDFKNTFLGLGVCFMGSSEPVPCVNKKLGKLDISLWTKLSFNDITIQDIIDKFNDEYKLNIDQIMYNDSTLYSTFMNENKKQIVLNKKISNLIDKTDNKNIVLSISVSDNSDESDESDNSDIILVEINLK